MIMATFTRASVAHKQDGSQVASGVPRYEAGQNGQAIMVEEGTVNLYADGDYAAGVATHPVRSGPWSVVADPTGRWVGNVLRANPHTGTAYHGRDIAVTLDTTYTATVWCYVSPDCDLSATRLVWEGGATIHTFYNMAAKGTWQLLTLSRPAPATNMRLLAYTSAAFTTGYVLYRNMQAEGKPYATSFAPGTRSAETLSLPTAGLIFPTEGCIEIDFQLVRLAAIYQPIFSTQIASGNRLLIMGNSGRIKVWDGDGTSELIVQADAILAAGQWYRVAYAWGPGGRTLALDGAIKTAPRGNTIGVAASAFLGSWGGYSPVVLFDRIRIFNRALSDAELLASYQGGL